MRCIKVAQKMLNLAAISFILLFQLTTAQYSQILSNKDISKLYNGVWAILIYRPNDPFSTPILQKWPEIIANVNNSSYQWAQIASTETRLISILEAKALPSVK